MIEIWKDIDNYKNKYQISNLGNVRNSKLLIMKPYINMHGYKVFSLYKKCIKVNFSLHRLIAIAFIPNPENKRCVNHKDGNKLNNNIENLEWCTSSENNIHALVNNLRIPIKGEKSTNSKLTEEEIRHIRKTKGIITNQEIANFYCVSKGVIGQIRTNRIWKHVI